MKLLLITTTLACIGLLTTATHIAAAQEPEQPQPEQAENMEEPEEPQPKKKINPLSLLKKAERTAREVAEDHLRKQKVGKETQDKEEEIIKAFDDLIEYILGAGAQQQQQQQGQSGQCQSGQKSGKPGGKPGEGKQQSGKPGGSKPSSMAGKSSNPQKGKATGFQKPSGKGEGGKQKDEWGFLPDKDFEATAREESAELPPGYQRLIERYRRVVSTEMTKIRR